jgi:hypothetical protein
MIIYIGPNMEYPRYAGDIMLLYPDWKIGDSLPSGWSTVLETEMLTPKADEVVVEDTPELVDNVWTQRWSLRKASQTEIQAKQEVLDFLNNKKSLPMIK